MEKVSSILKKCYNIDWKDKVILECGAGPHGDESHEFINENDCYYLEPVKEYFSILSSIKNNNKIFNMGLSDVTSNNVNFSQTSHLGNGSINHSQDHIEELKKYNSTFENIKIKTITYKDFLNIINKNIDLLILDVEGHELNILKTFLHFSEEIKPKILVIECGYDWEDRLNLLKKLEYTLDFYYFNNAYLTLNSFFVQKNTDMINNVRKLWPSWSWNGKVIYNDTDI